MLNNYSRIRLISDNYKDEGVPENSVGYIIETYDYGAYEVEFSEQDGTTTALLVLKESELELAELTDKLVKLLNWGRAILTTIY